MRVHILATCRKPELLPYTLCVFKTLRVGFPTAEVVLWFNGILKGTDNHQAICDAAGPVCVTSGVCDTTHHEWVKMLLETATEPFWICDTDIIFYENFERFKFDGPLAGCRIPEFRDEFSGAITRSRLHTSLLYFNPQEIGKALMAYREPLNQTPFTPQIDLIHPAVLPFKRKSYFYDTCSLLYHAVGGQDFTEEQKAGYFHFHFGTISDIVLPRLPNAQQMASEREKILSNPELGRDRWREFEEYLAARQP